MVDAWVVVVVVWLVDACRRMMEREKKKKMGKKVMKEKCENLKEDERWKKRLRGT